jgi:ABC-2 type transport system ATP-binding protein
MDNAHIFAMDTTENLLKLPGLSTSLRFRVDQAFDAERLKLLGGVVNVEHEDHSYRLVTNNSEATLADLFKFGRETGFKLLDLQLHQPTLEDVFLKLTGHGLRD